MFIHQAMRSIFVFSLVTICVSFNSFVIAQTLNGSGQTPNSASPSRRSTPTYRRPTTETEEDKRVKDIKSQITQNKEVKTMCSNYFNNITFESTSNQLRIDTGNNFCSYTIVKEILEPQLNTGKLRTYEFTGDREGVIVYFN